MKTPLFSTYRHGENRVTSSIIAVFERIGLGRVEQLLAIASDDSTLEMIKFENQLSRGDAVPDASLSADFHYLFEVKTTRSAVNPDQLTDPLDEPPILPYHKNIRSSARPLQ